MTRVCFHSICVWLCLQILAHSWQAANSAKSGVLSLCYVSLRLGFLSLSNKIKNFSLAQTSMYLIALVRTLTMTLTLVGTPLCVHELGIEESQKHIASFRWMSTTADDEGGQCLGHRHNFCIREKPNIAAPRLLGC